jgi:hypothetical protein
MKIPIYAPYAKERFETAGQHSILHLERIVGNPSLTKLGKSCLLSGRNQNIEGEPNSFGQVVRSRF